MDELSPKQKSAVARAVKNPDLVWVLMSKAKGAKWLAAFDEVGWLDPEKFPGPTDPDEKGFFSFPSWPLTHYLAENANDFLMAGNRSAAEQAIKFMSDATRIAKERRQHNYRVWWNFAKAIHGIPADLVSEKHSWMFAYWLTDPFDRGLTGEELSKWASTLLESESADSHRIALLVLQHVFALRVGETGEDERVGLAVSEWYAERIGKRSRELAVDRLGVAFVELLRARLEEATQIISNDEWSCIWRPAIEDHAQNRSGDSAQNVLISLLRDALEQLVRDRPSESQAYVEHLLGSNLQVLQRVAIHCVRVTYPQLEPLIDTIVEPKFFRSPYRHEVWWLLHDHYRHLTVEQRRAVLELINSLEERDESGVREAEATAYRQACWLAAIRDDAEGGARYEERVRVARAEPDHPDFVSYTTVGWVDYESPIGAEDLKALDPEELVTRLQGYVEPANRSFRGSGYEGLVKSLRPIIKADPLKYLSGLNSFRRLDLAFIYEVIEAYAELWREEVSLPWDAIWPGLLQFGIDVVSEDSYWIEENKTSQRGFVGNRHWINGALGRLVEIGARKDERAMPPTCHASALHLLDLLLLRETGEKFETSKDAVSIAINSPRGRCLEGLINLTLHECRIEDKAGGGHQDTWTKFVSYYDREFHRQSEYEFTTLFVNYLPNFLYLSKAWTLSRLPDVFDRGDSIRWTCAMQAYAYVTNVYQEIYSFLRDEGHFAAALDDETLADRSTEKIIQNACVAYLHGQEQLDESGGLMSLVLQRRNQKEISHIIRFFWSLRDNSKLKEEERERVVLLWVAFDRMARDGSSEGSVPLGKFVRWMDYLPRLDGEYLELALRAADALRDTHDNYTYDLLRTIARRSAETPKEAAVIWLSALAGSQMTYPEEGIQVALKNIVASGSEGRHLAKQVVSAYAKKGNLKPHEILKSITHAA